jgi:glycyl-tRNA synthetase
MSYSLDTIVAWAKRKGFVYPGSDIYGGLANAWDFGPYGVLFRNNIEQARWKFFISDRDDMVGMDSQILMNSRTWEASGHVAGFNDPLIDCKACKARYRADKLIEDGLKIELNGMSFEEMKAIIDAQWKCEKCGKKEWTDIRQFNMMFQTQQGAVEGDIVYLRPETAQGIFVNFKNVCDTTRMRVPFGIGQTGKAFRNEITPGNFMFRTREFYQMEIEYFCHPDSSMEKFEEWVEACKEFWYTVIGIQPEHLKFREIAKEDLAHYSQRTIDVEYLYPWGFGELQGLAHRGNFDLTQHQEFSGKNLQYIDPKTGERYLPHVIEPSWGLNRTILACMMEWYHEEEVKEGDTRVVVKFPKHLAPIKFAVLPLMEKDEGMSELARKIFGSLKKKGYTCEYDGSGNIGKRYRRQDEIGTPYCVTIDHQSLEDGTVTVRERDSMEQVRVKWEEISL